MAILVSGIVVEHREVKLSDKPNAMIAASAKGTVPIVVLPCGTVFDESLDIMHWALGNNDPENWRASIDDALISTNDGAFKAALDRYKYPHRFGLSVGIADREIGLLHLQRLNTRLTDSIYLSGPNKSFTDIALFPFIRQFAATDTMWFNNLPLPALQKWLDCLTNGDLFHDIMEKHPVWRQV
jgi:glutathione S-transferase